ncbi:MAG: phosphate signaling complex protein PhoU [Fimbriimonas sp.]
MSVPIPNVGRHAYHTEMALLEHDLLEMASRAERMVQGAVESLTRLDTETAMAVIVSDDEVDELDLAIEGRCLRLLALQQPMGTDLRTVGTMMKMITDVERVGDLAVDIAKITLKVEKEYGEVSFIDLPRMANAARSMLREALQAFVRRDLVLVHEVVARDEEVDQLYRELRAQIFANMRECPDMVVSDGWLLMAIHHVERIADHAVNIAERVSFMVTGEFRQLATSHRSDKPEAD